MNNKQTPIEKAIDLIDGFLTQLDDIAESKNKQSMKLYTEEQVKKAIELALHGFGIGGIEDTIEVVASKFTPIELPSDEEIREERLLQFPDSEYASRANDRLAFYCGAQYVINKIKGGDK